LPACQSRGNWSCVSDCLSHLGKIHARFYAHPVSRVTPHLQIPSAVSRPDEGVSRREFVLAVIDCEDVLHTF
jgi:hypothetical protein